MKKILLSLFMLSVLVLSFGMVSAWDIDRLEITDVILNGVDQVTVLPSETISTDIEVNTHSWVWRSTRYQIEGEDSKCINVPSPNLYGGTHSRNFPITAPSNEGTYDFEVKVYQYDGCHDTEDDYMIVDGIIVVESICGNEITEGEEECDGEINCEANCTFETDAPVITFDADPIYPICSEDVEVCATVTDVSDISFVNIACTAGSTTITKSNVVANGDQYCETFSGPTMSAIDATQLVCTVEAEDALGNNGDENQPNPLAVYDCADPVAVITGSFTCNEGTTVTLSGADSHDTVTPTNELIYSWTGVTTSDGDSATVDCIDDGMIDVTLTVEDHVERTDSVEETIEVLNVDPVAYVAGDTTAFEGSDVTLIGSETDVGVEDTHTFLWTVDGTETTGESLTVHCVDEELITATLEVEDDDFGTDTMTHEIQCLNAKPIIVSLTTDSSIDEEEILTLTASATDAGVNDLPFSYLINWGDSDTTTGSTTDGLISETHQYMDDGTYSVTLTVTDNDDLDSDEETTEVIVNNLAPWDLTIEVEDSPAYVGETICFYGSATDVDADTITYDWNFGDENSDSDSYVCHSYSERGIYTITMTASDEDGGVNLITTTVEIFDYSIELSAGWNLISIPLISLDDDSSIGNVFTSVSENVEAVWSYAWDGEKNVWTYNEFTSGVASNTDELQNIVPGYGYYVKMTEDDELFLNGKKFGGIGAVDFDQENVIGIPPSVTLAMNSWNLIGTYGLNDINKGCALKTLTNEDSNKYYDILYTKDGDKESTIYSKAGSWLSMKLVEHFGSIEYKANYETEGDY